MVLCSHSEPVPYCQVTITPTAGQHRGVGQSGPVLNAANLFSVMEAIAPCRSSRFLKRVMNGLDAINVNIWRGGREVGVYIYIYLLTFAVSKVCSMLDLIVSIRFVSLFLLRHTTYEHTHTHAHVCTHTQTHTHTVLPVVRKDAAFMF